MIDHLPDYRPAFPERERYGIAILGFGGIAHSAHLPAYTKYGLDVRGVWSRTSTHLDGVDVPRVYASVEELLEDPEVDIVDIATPVVGRTHWISAAIEAGKHVLAQKPLTDDPDGLAPALTMARQRGLRVAVNQNARWAPAWRLATLLVQQGAIGQVQAITHIHDKPLPPVASRPAATPEDEHLLVSDYLNHWFDITRCWLAGKTVVAVSTIDRHLPAQPPAPTNPWSVTSRLECQDGSHALIHIPGNVPTSSGSCPFWIHGTEGSIRGSVLLRSDYLELERGDQRSRIALQGEWFVDGFAGAMGELMLAIAEGREAYNSAEHNLASLHIADAALRSARRDGTAVDLEVAL